MTTSSSSGKVTDATSNTSGIQAANQKCQADYPDVSTAHICTPDEAMRAMIAQNISSALSNGQTAWALGTAYNSVGGTYYNNCQNLKYESGDVALGTTITISAEATSSGGGGGATGNAINVISGVGCGASFPILCCR